MSQITFTNIKFPVKNTYLRNLSSSIRANKLTAIIGPSGSGKTSLIKIISGRSSCPYHGEVFYDNFPVRKHDMLKNSMFVHQDDVFLPYLTVQETIKFYETLRNRKHGDSMDLTRVFKNYVGTSEKGISAGERKRLSILIGMIDDTDIIFLDEPTSGLDSLNALNMIKMLKSINGTKVCVVHQPSAEMFFMFDEIMIMMDGSIIYQDTPQNVFKWFDLLGKDCPKYTNPADHIFTHILPHYKNNQSIKFNETTNNIQINEVENKVESAKTTYNPSWLLEFKLLLKRNAKSILRDKMIGIARILQSLYTAIIIASIYNKTYEKEITSRVENIKGLLYVLSMNIFYSAAMASIPELYKSQNVLLREFTSRYYRYSSFLAAKILTDTTLNLIHVFFVVPIVFAFSRYNNGFVACFTIFLSCGAISLVGHSYAVLASAICPTIQVASASLPAFIMPLTLLNGLFLDTSTVPFLFKMLQYISPSRYVFNIMMKCEFAFIPVDYPKNTVYEWHIGIKASFLGLMMIYAFNILIAYYLLKRKINKRI